MWKRTGGPARSRRTPSSNHRRRPREGRPKRGLQAAIAAEVCGEVEALVGEGAVDNWDFEAIEMAARHEALRVAGRAVEQRLNADTSDHHGATASCVCGKQARFTGRHPKALRSVLGPLRLDRAYYHCEACQAGFCRGSGRWVSRDRLGVRGAGPARDVSTPL